MRIFILIAKRTFISFFMLSCEFIRNSWMESFKNYSLCIKWFNHRHFINSKSDFVLIHKGFSLDNLSVFSITLKRTVCFERFYIKFSWISVQRMKLNHSSLFHHSQETHFFTANNLFVYEFERKNEHSSLLFSSLITNQNWNRVLYQI